eukprot:9162534-Ditylum_brightwellii.AAC.1
MNAHLLEHHKRHFSQTYNTPFTVSPLNTLIGYTAEGPLALELKKGTCNIQELPVDPYTKYILKELQWKLIDPPKSCKDLSWQEVQQSFKLWNKNKATSPPGRYLSKCKVWIRKEEKEERECKNGSEIKQEEFFQIITNIVRTSLLLRVPLQRCLPVHNICIYNKAGNAKISRMRTIQKVDAEPNLFRCTHILCRTMHNAEKHNFIHDDLHGGQHGRTAIDPVVITTLNQETFHFQRANTTETDCNAAACYDRMILGITSIAETNACTPKEVSVLLGRMLMNTKHHMNTEKGISKEYNSCTDEKLIYRTGLGAMDYPQKWNFNDNIIAKSYVKKAKGCMTWDPTQTVIKDQFSVRFIDGITQLHNSEKFDIPAKALMQQIQNDITLHSRYLWIMGGKLETIKTKYILMIWRFDRSGKPILTEEMDLPLNNIEIPTTTGQTTVLERIPVQKGISMLG